MPVVVNLSKAFYDRFGDDIVSEMVEVLNEVEGAAQRSLHEINDLNYARFEARLEQRISELRAELRVEMAALRAELVGAFHAGMVVQMRWMVAMWATTTLAVVGLWFRR